MLMPQSSFLQLLWGLYFMGLNLIRTQQKLNISLQKFLSFVNFLWFAPLMVMILKLVFRFKINELEEFRTQVLKLSIEKGERPIVIAANHLTVIDSLIINWALYSWPQYLRQFRDFPWNVPEASNFARNPALRIMCYLGKCIFIQRSGSRDHKKQTLSKLKYLGQQGESLCIFPEGGRGKSGTLDISSATYGIGEILNELHEPIVWAIYLRGGRQDGATWLPKRGERFTLSISAIEVKSESKGRRAAREKTLTIFQKLIQMEGDYFDSRKRSHRSQPSATAPKVFQ